MKSMARPLQLLTTKEAEQILLTAERAIQRNIEGGTKP